jgi:hypothetical protein
MDICHECCVTVDKLNNEYDILYEEKELYKKALFSQTKIVIAKKKLKEIYPNVSDHNRDFNGWIDYPIVDSEHGKCTVWDEYLCCWCGELWENCYDPPTLKEIKENSYGGGVKGGFGNVIEILDFANSYKGSLCQGIVIYDKEISEYRKFNLLKAVNTTGGGFNISLMKADNILNGILDEEKIFKFNMKTCVYEIV